MVPIFISKKVSKTKSLGIFIINLIIATFIVILFIGLILINELSVISFILGAIVFNFTYVIICLILKLRLNYKVKNVSYDENGCIYIDEIIFSASKVDYIKKNNKVNDLYVISIDAVCYYFFANSNYENRELMKFYSNFDFDVLFKFNKKLYIHKSVELFANRYNIRTICT